MPALVAKEREAAAAARSRVAEQAQKLSVLQGELDERIRCDRKLTHELGLVQKRAEASEGRVQALHAKQVESVKVRGRLVT